MFIAAALTGPDLLFPSTPPRAKADGHMSGKASAPMGDMEKVIAECRAKHGGEEISDACARVIASLYHEGQWSLSYSFASTGAIADPTHVWREMFATLYSGASGDKKIVMDMMGTYLTRAGKRGPVRGWSDLWL